MLYGKDKLKGVDGKLAQVVEAAASLSPFDIVVTEGVRTKERQEELYAQGRTKPGNIVTWTLNSKHIEGKAVDVCPYFEKGGKRYIPWDDKLLFVALGRFMLEAADKLGVKIRWGYDWDGDGALMEKGESDGPHFEMKE